MGWVFVGIKVGLVTELKNENGLGRRKEEDE